MKLLLSVCLLVLGATSFASESVTYGYLARGNDGSVNYMGISEQMVDTQFGVESFSPKQAKVAKDCMEDTLEYAIRVLTVSTRREVPSSIPGRNTFFTDFEVESVTCVPAEDFIVTWRKFFNYY